MRDHLISQMGDRQRDKGNFSELPVRVKRIGSASVQQTTCFAHPFHFLCVMLVILEVYGHNL